MNPALLIARKNLFDSSEASPQTDEITSQVRRRSFARKLDTFVKFLRNKDALYDGQSEAFPPWCIATRHDRWSSSREM